MIVTALPQMHHPRLVLVEAEVRVLPVARQLAEVLGQEGVPTKPLPALATSIQPGNVGAGRLVDCLGQLQQTVSLTSREKV